MKLRNKTKATIERLGFKQPTERQARRNPNTGKQHVLEPEACQLYDFVVTRVYVCGKDYTRQEWDNARYYFLSKWPDEYYDLID